jgi:hypothetical protein
VRHSDTAAESKGRLVRELVVVGDQGQARGRVFRAVSTGTGAES